MRRVKLAALAIAAAAGCWTDPPAAEAPHEPREPHGPPVAFTMTEAGVGPIDAQSPATLAGMRKLFPGYDVRPINDPGLEYHVFSGREELLYVVTNDDLSVFNVHATSGRIEVSGRGWRVGKPFHDAHVLTQCECWGDNPTCFHAGEHIAVNFKRDCDGITGEVNRRALQVLDGLAPQRVIWSPTSFGADAGATGGDGAGTDAGSDGGDDDDGSGGP